MVRPILLLLLLCFFAISGCKKENLSASEFTSSNALFDSSIRLLKATLSAEDFGQLDLAKYRELKYRNKTLGFKIFEKNSSANEFLLLGLDPTGYIGNWVDLSGLKKNQSNVFSGLIKLESLTHDVVTKLTIDNNNAIQSIKSSDQPSSDITVNFNQGSSLLATPENVSSNPWLPEIIVTIGGGSKTGMSMYWLLDQRNYFINVFSLERYENYYGFAGFYPGDINSEEVIAIPTETSPDKPIVDVKNEVKCFTNDNSSTYSISVNINQPTPNSRDLLNPFSDFQVGHTYFSLDQLLADGSHIIRNLGFYPKNAVKPGNSVDKSIFGNDSYTPYDVSLKFSVTGSEFMTVVNNLVSQQSTNYDLDNFNCTNSVMSALSSININLPSTKSNELLNCNNPADLGEDIRNLNLDDFSKANGNRKITRTTSNFNNEKPPLKQGSC